MPCPHCPSRLGSAGHFCPDCGGSRLPGERPDGPLNTGSVPVFRVVPRFAVRTHLLDRWPFLVFLLVWGTWILGGIVTFAGEAAESPVDAAATFGGAFVLFLFVVPLLSLRVSWVLEREARLVFHPNRLEARLGRHAQRTVPLSRLRGVELAASGRGGLGTVLLDVRDLDDGGAPTIRLADVPDAARVVDRIRALLDETHGPGGELRHAA
jgi:hypothetical protein